MPVGERTITRCTDNHSQKQPRRACKKKRDQIKQSSFFPYPTNSIENGQRRMKNNKENIQYGIDGMHKKDFLYNKSTAIFKRWNHIAKIIFKRM